MALSPCSTVSSIRATKKSTIIPPKRPGNRTGYYLLLGGAQLWRATNTKARCRSKNVYFNCPRQTGTQDVQITRQFCPDPFDLIDRYGADGVRMGMMLSAPRRQRHPALLTTIALCEQGRNFNNKIWNAFRLVKGWEVSEEVPAAGSCRTGYTLVQSPNRMPWLPRWRTCSAVSF